MNKPRKKQRDVYLIAIVMTITILFSVYLRYRMSEKDIIKETEEVLYNSALEQQVVLENTIIGLFETLETLSKAIAADSDDTLSNFYQKLSIPKKGSSFSSFGVIYPDGSLIIDSGAAASVADRLYFKYSMAGKRYIEKVVGVFSGEPKFVLSVPISKDKTVIGVLIGVFDVYKLTVIFNRSAGSDYKHLMICDPKGEIILQTGVDTLVFPNNKITSLLEISESSNAKIGTMETNMQKGAFGFIQFSLSGLKYYATYLPAGINN